jgi:predicted dehydrogenase
VIHTSFISRGLDDANGTYVHLDVAGSSGRLRNEGLATIKGINGLGNQDVLSVVPPGPAYPQPYEQFARAILTGEPVRSSFTAGLQAARLRDAAQLAADEERWVALS